MDKALIGAGGALLCVLVGHILTRWWEGRRWKRDQKLLEFRELVTAITTAMTNQQHYILGDGLREDEIESHKVAIQVITNRIFILEDVKRLKIGERYFDGRSKLLDDHDEDAFARIIGDMLSDIVYAAQRI